jgi:hypothetical protein
MKVTAFHLINKIEEASQSYFSNSMIFSSQKIGTDRIVDFRNQQAALTFFIDNGSEDENIEMGSIAVETVQEKEEKIAFQCSCDIQPSGFHDDFFMLLPSNREAYAQYMEFIDRMKKHWEKQPQHYLPSMDSSTALEDSSSSAFPDMDDEYEGLTPEEIEAVTGVRPGASEDTSVSDDVISADELAALTGAEDDNASDSDDNMSMEDLESLISSSQDDDESAADESESQELSEGDIASMLGGLDEESAPPESQTEELPEESSAPVEEKTEDKSASTEGEGELEMSAEDIWKQISGGQPMQ